MLTTPEIAAQLKGVKFFIGVFSADRLPAVLRRPATLIVNTDPSNEGGEHWVALHLRPGMKADYFCSFGLPPLVPQIQAFFNGHGEAGKRYNRCTMQAIGQTTCGDFCICYVKCVANGIELPEFVQRFRPADPENESLLTCVSRLSC